MKLTAFILLCLFLTSCNEDIVLEGTEAKNKDSTPSTPAIPPPASLDCPTGFVAVLGSGTLGTSDFCVMQFEAKNDGSGNAVSQATGNPYVSIAADDGVAANDNDAFEKCANMSESGYTGTFALISNPEWMTIARDLENVPSNWSGTVVGTGHIPRGHSDINPSSALPVTNTADSYDGTGNNSGEAAGSGWEQKRTHTLSNGSVIWDFSGNVGEWVDWDASDSVYSAAPTGCVDGGASNGWNDFDEVITGCSDGSDVDDVYPAGGYTLSQSFGRWYGGAGGAAVRGGSWANDTSAGAFALALDLAPTLTTTLIGFRCVYRP